MNKAKALRVAIVGTPLVAAVSWLAYSAFAIDHHRYLPPALPGRRKMVRTSAGSICLYEARLENAGSPLLLVHSVNAAASAYEMLPLFLYYGSARPVYALDLPGFGLSERRDRTYRANDMSNAIQAAAEDITRKYKGAPIDVLALSTSCEYAARAALDRPPLYRSLGLISPVGFDEALSGEGSAGSTKGNGLKLALVAGPWSQALYDLVVSAPSMRYFLEKTFGSSRIDEGLFAYNQLTSQQPNARHVVWSFLAGYLFAGDATRLYRDLTLPVWTCHGKRGDFVDFGKERQVAGRTNWTFAEFDTGAMPQFECLKELTDAYDGFAKTLR